MKTPTKNHRDRYDENPGTCETKRKEATSFQQRQKFCSQKRFIKSSNERLTNNIGE